MKIGDGQLREIMRRSIESESKVNPELLKSKEDLFSSMGEPSPTPPFTDGPTINGQMSEGLMKAIEMEARVDDLWRMVAGTKPLRDWWEFQFEDNPTVSGERISSAKEYAAAIMALYSVDPVGASSQYPREVGLLFEVFNNG